MSAQRVPTIIQQIFDRLLEVNEPHGGEVLVESASEIRIESRQVRKILKGRRQPQSRRTFRGFDSPPGRF